mmetsp:Transcript_34412/g.83247  ORF Transcript_34412/g.83247 Transcript_34412/m.83247 type:complete len:410 (+) Transcript_34412:133-1362(+)|eukprot:CAMPEP_0181120328 /NCGR_PEP_ID=MMETSP1071-20121207/24098_1 /TAXON_ID=35127 /ORGANISM="Thalassiosira sp., Strain NH16" /LENGTH=409 /DNA_ID=CAMNT_0023204977 /DNA_START=78 /DNA_END=1307 /DNA_ORIENTATION=-
MASVEAGWDITTGMSQGWCSDTQNESIIDVDEEKAEAVGVGARGDKTQTQECTEKSKASQADENLITEISDRLDRATALGEDDKLLVAAHILHDIDEKFLQPIHHKILKEAAVLKELLQENTGSLELNEGGWIKQGKHTGRHNFTIYYKLKEITPGQDKELSCRIETAIKADLLVPFLSVLNESELYATWLPNFKLPRLRVSKSEKLQQSGRVSQIINVETEIPWPLKMRQVILKAVACDNIDSYEEEDASDNNNVYCLGKDGGRIIIRIQSLDCPDSEAEGLVIPPVENGVVRMKVKGGFTMEKCPPDHPMKLCALQYDARTTNSITGDDLILVTFSFCVDPQLTIIPKSFINFFVRVAMGQMWNMFLNVAEDVKEGKRPEHSAVIARKRELYDWVEERTAEMMGRVS